MNLHELLQYELWSKDASRKILRPVGKLLKRVSVVLGALIVLIAIVFLIERYWLTDGERRAGRAALAQVEELQDLIDCNCNRFATVDDGAKTAVELADEKKWTLRDRIVAFDLSFYLMEVEEKQAQDLREAKLRVFMQQRHLQWHSDPKLEAKSRSLQFQIFSDLRSALHKELD